MANTEVTLGEKKPKKKSQQNECGLLTHAT